MYRILIVFSVLVLAVAAGCGGGNSITDGRVPSHTQANPYVTDLLAGQTMDVGEIQVWHDADDIHVTFIVDLEGWGLNETHLHIADSVDGIPAKNGNPIPGKFDYKMEHDNALSYEYVIDNTYPVDTQIFIAAHAVVSDELGCTSEAFMFGTERFGEPGADLWMFDAIAGTATVFATIDDPSPGTENFPNGLAWEPVTERLYYSSIDGGNPSQQGELTTDSKLWFWDGTSVVYAGPVPGMVAGGTIYDGAYYYIKNNTDDMMKVTFLPDGTIDTVAPLWPDFTGADDEHFRFGDMVVYPDHPDGPMLYGSTGASTFGTDPTFFRINILTGVYTWIADVNSGVDPALGLQLAVGSDGELYGHSAGNGDTFILDLDTGEKTFVSNVTVNGGHGFTDLASGTRCYPTSETGWGFGPGFDGKNWATYFSYDLHDIL